MDENWYAFDYGRISYDLRIDTALTERWVELVATEGLQTRRTNYEGFPIDTGTVVASALLDPGRRFELALVSCNLYAAVDDLATLGRCAAQAAAAAGRRVGVLAVTGLSSGLIQRWIEPGEDAIATKSQDSWNRRMINALTHGEAEQAFAMREQFAREAAADSQFRALAFLGGAGVLDTPAELLAYGPVWGTVGAVLHWTPECERNPDAQ
jgi:2-aminophenol/2-amino-5-chlorophenol 1,6-dioxygenase alpha subunit